MKHIYIGHGEFTSPDTIEVEGKTLKFHKVRTSFGSSRRSDAASSLSLRGGNGARRSLSPFY